jgi:hypothetical protein
MADGAEENKGLLTTLTAAFGLLAGLATIVTIAGTIAFVLRLHQAGLPADLGVVVSLPREFLIAVGVVYVAFPLLAVGVISVLALLVPGPENEPNPALMTPRKASNEQRASLGFYAIAGAVGLPFLVDSSPPARSFAVSTVTAAAFLYVAYRILDKYGKRPRSLVVSALLALAVAAFFGPWAVALAVNRAEFPPAAVCTTDGTLFNGVLIGETSDRVYLGEPKVPRPAKRRIAAFPSSEVQQVFVGGSGACRKSQAQAGDGPGVTPPPEPVRCVSRQGLPDPQCTPGARNPDVKQANIKQTICVPNWTKTVRPPTSYTNKLKAKGIEDYGFRDEILGHYEEDHLIPLSVGGSPRSSKNLWPEAYAGKWGARIKDKLERRLHKLVCAGRERLSQARSEISHDWVAAFKRQGLSR